MISLAHHFAGLDVKETLGAVAPDFSRCRSPSRARRRWRAGIPGRVVMKPTSYVAGRTLFVHPAIMQQLRNHVADKAVEMAAQFFKDLSFGQGGAVGASGGIVKPRPGGYLMGEQGREFIMPRGIIKYGNDVI